MIENKPAIVPEWDPDFEIVEYNSLYIALHKPERLTKPGRTLATLRPKRPEITQFFKSIEEPYRMRLEPQGWAGNHYHTKKMEIFCPFGSIPIIVHLKHVDTQQEEILTLSESQDHTYTEYLIPPRVAHAIVNPSILPTTYLVLSNMAEKEALEKDDIIDYEVIPLP